MANPTTPPSADSCTCGRSAALNNKLSSAALPCSSIAVVPTSDIGACTIGKSEALCNSPCKAPEASVGRVIC